MSEFYFGAAISNSLISVDFLEVCLRDSSCPFSEFPLLSSPGFPKDILFIDHVLYFLESGVAASMEGR